MLEGFVPQMRRKGRLQVGMDADNVVFDPLTITDRATLENANQTAIGVQTVMVNGVPIVLDAELISDAAPGEAILRTAE